MAQQTTLSIIATPGKPHSFSPKAAAAPESGPHTGLFTELSVTALPGKIHSFLAKDPAVPPAGGPHTGLFTELSVMALPGMRHSFSAKTAAEIVVAGSGMKRLAGARAEIGRRQPDDADLFDIIMIAIQSGRIFNG